MFGLRSHGCVADVLTGTEAVGGRVSATCILGGCAGGDEAVEGVGGRLVVKMAAHAFICGEVAGDLKELDEEKHGHPCELKGGPDGEDNGIRIFVEFFTKLVGENDAGDTFRLADLFKV